LNAEFGDRLTVMFGSDEWVPIVTAARRGELTPAQQRAELVNLMRWRLEHVLRYRMTHVFTMRNASGQDLYDMIFTTDHPAGDRIMRDIYSKAMSEHENMR
jgi:three-Cys-motif partner protein